MPVSFVVLISPRRRLQPRLVFTVGKPHPLQPRHSVRLLRRLQRDSIASHFDSLSSAVPKGHATQDWSDLSSVSIGECQHGRRAVMKKCTDGRNTGRRYLGCPLQNECQFKEWIDDPWPARVQKALKDLWMQLRTSRRCESTANASLIEALQLKEVATKANGVLVRKVARTKRVAHTACTYYNKKVTVAIKMRNKLIKLVYCLLGIICLLVVVIIFLAFVN